MSEEEIKKLREVAYHVEKMLNLHHSQLEEMARRLEALSSRLQAAAIELAEIRSEVRTTARLSGGVTGAAGGAAITGLIEVAKMLAAQKTGTTP